MIVDSLSAKCQKCGDKVRLSPVIGNGTDRIGYSPSKTQWHEEKDGWVCGHCSEGSYTLDPDDGLVKND